MKCKSPTIPQFIYCKKLNFFKNRARTVNSRDKFKIIHSRRLLKLEFKCFVKLCTETKRPTFVQPTPNAVFRELALHCPYFRG